MKIVLRTLLLAGLGLVLLITLSWSNLGGRAIGGLGWLSAPFLRWSVGLKSKLRQNVVSPFQAKRLTQTVEGLAQENRRLNQENVRVRELEAENASLRRMLKFVEEGQASAVVARIIGRVSEGGSDFFVLNQGAKHSIGLDLPVTVDGVLVGKIIKVHSSVSIAAPLTAPTIKTAATFSGKEQTAGIVEGELNVNLVMTLIPKDVAVETGASIITSGLEPAVPRGLLLGHVARLTSTPNDLFQTAYLTPLTTLAEANLVTVLQTHANP